MKGSTASGFGVPTEGRMVTRTGVPRFRLVSPPALTSYSLPPGFGRMIGISSSTVSGAALPAARHPTAAAAQMNTLTTAHQK